MPLVPVDRRLGDGRGDGGRRSGCRRGRWCATLDRYNEHAARGEDPDFHKHPDWLAPQDTGPWGAFDLTLGNALYAGFTLGGIRTTVDGEAQRARRLGGPRPVRRRRLRLQPRPGRQGLLLRHPARRGVVLRARRAGCGHRGGRTGRPANLHRPSDDARALRRCAQPRQRAAVPRDGPAGGGSAERQRTHGDLVNLLAGQPSTGAPAPVNAEAIRLLSSGDPLGYTPATGIPELREAIAGHHRRPHGIDVGRRRRRGDDRVERRLPAGVPGGVRGRRPGGDGPARLPLLPQRADRARLRGRRDPDRPGDPVPADRRAARAEPRAAPSQGVVVASPANPTGTMLLPDELAAIARWCEERGVQLVSDEIYHGIEYAPRRPAARRARAWETSREAVVFCSFSKYFSMTGWRIGWMLVPERLRRAGRRADRQLHDLPARRSRSAPASRRSTTRRTPSSTATSRRYAGNRRLLLDGLPRLGITELAPGRRRVLRLRRRRAPDRRLDGLRPRPAGAHRRRGRARHRLRHRGRPPVHPVQLRRPARRHRGGAGSASTDRSCPSGRSRAGSGRAPTPGGSRTIIVAEGVTQPLT